MSIKGHTSRRKWIGHDFVYGANRAEGHEESYLEAYRNHTSSVRGFFAVEGKSKLLEWVIDAKDVTKKTQNEKWGILLIFLGMEDSEEIRDELGEFPRTSRTDSWRDKKFMKSIWLGMGYDHVLSGRSLIEDFGVPGWLTGGMS
jgi:hypothetical protein